MIKIGPTLEIPNRSLENSPHKNPNYNKKFGPICPRKHSKMKLKTLWRKYSFQNFLGTNSQKLDKYSQNQTYDSIPLKI